jgi:hypothetical protein
MMKMKSVVTLERFPKILSPLSHIGSLEARFQRSIIPSHDVGRKAAWGRPDRQLIALEPGGCRIGSVVYVVV